jgi:hypothetical protein
LKYVTTDYTVIVQVVDDYDAEHMAHLFKALDITSTISIASESTSGKKLSATKVKLEDVKKKQIAAFVGDELALKATCELCKGHCKTFVFICSTIAPKLLEDISGMSNSCPLALWTVINNQYGNNDITLQAAWCDLGWPNFYLVRPGDTVHSIWARIQALVNVLAVETRGHKMLEWSCLVILATASTWLSRLNSMHSLTTWPQRLFSRCLTTLRPPITPAPAPTPSSTPAKASTMGVWHSNTVKHCTAHTHRHHQTLCHHSTQLGLTCHTSNVVTTGAVTEAAGAPCTTPAVTCWRNVARLLLMVSLVPCLELLPRLCTPLLLL